MQKPLNLRSEMLSSPAAVTRLAISWVYPLDDASCGIEQGLGIAADHPLDEGFRSPHAQ